MKKLIMVLFVAVIGGIVLIAASAQSEEKEYTVEEYNEVVKEVQSGEIKKEETHENIRNLAKDGEVEIEKVRVESSNVQPVTELTVGGFADPMYYRANSELRSAHRASAAITHHSTFNNGGEPLNLESVLKSLEGIQRSLSFMEYEGQKSEEIQKVADMTNQAIKQKADIGDEILEEIHTNLHELDEHFNINKLKEQKVDKYGVPLD